MAHLNNGSFTLDWRTENKMSKLSLLLQLSFLPYNFGTRKKSSINQMKTVTSERCNNHTLCHSIRSIIKKDNTIYDNCILHCIAIKKNKNDQTFT